MPKPLTSNGAVSPAPKLLSSNVPTGQIDRGVGEIGELHEFAARTVVHVLADHHAQPRCRLADEHECTGAADLAGSGDDRALRVSDGRETQAYGSFAPSPVATGQPATCCVRMEPGKSWSP
jgi:hypothetical protein